MLVLAIGTALPYRLGPHYFLPRSFIAFYGMESVRFTAPWRPEGRPTIWQPDFLFLESAIL